MELGSEFNLNFRNLGKKEDNIFDYLKEYNCIYTDSGRSALRILQDMISKRGKILLPSYTCDSVIECFEESRIDYYDLDYELNIVWQKLDSMLEQEVAAVVIMHYFGKMQDKNILQKIKEKCKKRDILIIEDTTHSIFNQICTIGDYCICSLRKWFAIPDGGVLYSFNVLPKGDISSETEWSQEKMYGMFLKTFFLEKGYSCNQWYRELFAESEDKLEHQKEIFGISEMASILLSGYSISDMIQKRRTNYQRLATELEIYGILLWKEMPECPFLCPIMLEDRDEFRKYLIEQRIYCAVHWPITRQKLINNEVVDYTAKHVLSLPIDQRYGEEHIDYLKEKLTIELDRRRGDRV